MKHLLFIVFILKASLSLSQSDTIYFETLDIENQANITQISRISADLDGNIWIGSAQGLHRFDGYKYTLYEESKFSNSSLKENKTRGMHLDRNGDFWIAGEYSGYKLDRRNDQLIRTTDGVYEQTQELYYISYFDVAEIDNYIVYASKIGLQFYDKEKEKITFIDTMFQDVAHDYYSTNIHVHQIENDPNNPNNLWLLTRRGLIYYDSSKKKATLVKADIDIPFHKMQEAGSNMCMNDGHIYFLINYLDLYSYDISKNKWTKIEEPFETEDRKFKRNIIPYKQGFLIAYIRYGLYQYNHLTGSLSQWITKNMDTDEKMSLSYTGVDHTGHLIFIQNNKLLVRSVEPIIPEKRIKNHEKVFLKDLVVNDVAIDTFNDEDVLHLHKNQRNLSFSIGLTNRNHHANESYFYRFDDTNHWTPLPSRHVQFENLSPNISKIYTRIESDSRIFEGKPLELSMEKFFYERNVFWGLLSAFLLAVVGSILYLFFSRKKDRRKHESQILQLEMDALRSQMNPHFLFNSLNSIKNYVVSRSKDEAADYVTNFSKLIRMILENSRKKFIDLEDELKMLKLYIEMENKRLNGTINTQVEVDPAIRSDYKLSPMLIQPFVENAIWHGLMHKKGDRNLLLKFESNEHGISCIVRDNGVGRSSKKKEFAIQSKKSLGTSITSDRVDVINKIYGVNNEVRIVDLFDDKNEPAGTEVHINFPQLSIQS